MTTILHDYSATLAGFRFMRMLATLFVFFTGCVPGCSKSAWDKYPMATMPDQQCYRGGAVQGRDIYIWNCVDGERVLIEKYSAEMSASAPERYTTACGGVTEFEARERLTDADCRSHRVDWHPSN